MTEHAVAFGQKTIRFSLDQKPRKALRISVMPDLSVGVSAPHDFSIETVLRKVQRRAAWIVRQIDYFKSFMPKETPRQFVSGETHYYYGRQYRLKVHPVRSKSPEVTAAPLARTSNGVRAGRQEVKLKGKYIYV
jgi:predicted metal-dependent hydrolase